jgi:hypothetical protein
MKSFKLTSENFFNICIVFLLIILLSLFICISIITKNFITEYLSLTLIIIKIVNTLLMGSLNDKTQKERKKLQIKFIKVYNITDVRLLNDLFNNVDVFPANYSFISNLEIYFFYSFVKNNDKLDMYSKKYIKFKSKYENVIPYTMSFFEYYLYLKTYTIDYYKNAAKRLIPYEKKYETLLEYDVLLTNKVKPTTPIFIPYIIDKENFSSFIAVDNIGEINSSYINDRNFLYIKQINMEENIIKLSSEIISCILYKVKKDNKIKNVVIDVNPYGNINKIIKEREEYKKFVPFIVQLILNIISNKD